MVEPLRLDNVIVRVPDVSAAATWYHNHIGLTVVLVTDTIAVLHTRDHGPGICLTYDPAIAVTLERHGQLGQQLATVGPLVTALTIAVVEAAEEFASRSAGGRLATPLLGVLDEVANVCRWRALPDRYSHYGSRGIVLMTVLQSWS